MQYIIVFIIIAVYAFVKEGINGFLEACLFAIATIAIGFILAFVLHFLGFNKK